MSKQQEIINQLNDRVNGLEAICLDLLSHHFQSEAQGRIRFDDYRFKNTQEAIDKREAEAKAKQLRENLAVAKSDFRDKANSEYWTLVFLSDKEKKKQLDDIWTTITAEMELPKGAKRPDYQFVELTEDKLIDRRNEINHALDRINTALAKDTIEHSEKSMQDVTLSLEANLKNDIAKLKVNTKISDSERAERIRNREQETKIMIRKHLQDCRRRIDASKTTLKQYERLQVELKHVKKALAVLLTK